MERNTPDLRGRLNELEEQVKQLQQKVASLTQENEQLETLMTEKAASNTENNGSRQHPI